MRKIIIYLLFFISCSPLLLYLWITKSNFPKNITELNTVSINYADLYLFITILSFLLFFIILRSIKNTAPCAININLTKNKNEEFLTYIMTYFFTFLTLDFSSIQKLLGSLFLFLFIAFVYSKSNLIYTNPILILFGFSIYEAEAENSKKIMIISKEKNLVGSNIPLIEITDNIFFYKQIL